MSCVRSSEKSGDKANTAKEDQNDKWDKGKGKDTGAHAATDKGWAATSIFGNREIDVTDLIDEPIEAAESAHQGEQVKIYNSGATSHMTPYRDMLVNYREIPKR